MGTAQASRPSPAVVIAVLALVAALAGTAVASSDASTSALTKAKVKKIAKKQINKLAPSLSVANAQNAVNAQNAATAANGATGYGNFKPDGTVQPGAFNMNNLTVSSAVSWTYCEDQAFKTVVVTGAREAGGSGTISLASAINRQNLTDNGQTPADFGCPANTEWVYMTHQLGGSVGPAYFQVVGF